MERRVATSMRRPSASRRRAFAVALVLASVWGCRRASVLDSGLTNAGQFPWRDDVPEADVYLDGGVDAHVTDARIDRLEALDRGGETGAIDRGGTFDARDLSIDRVIDDAASQDTRPGEDRRDGRDAGPGLQFNELGYLVEDDGGCSLPADASGFDVPYLDAPTYDAPDPSTVVRLIRPLSGMRVTRHRPLLRWALPPGADGARIELCRDRACTQPLDSFGAIGTEGRPTNPLPPGPVFWRAFARRDGVIGARASHTWEFWVNRRDAAFDSAYGSIRDMDGDGYDEVVIADWDHVIDRACDDSAPGANGRVYIYRGRLGGVSTVPDAILDAETGGGQWGVSLTLGDLNGDGLADLVVGSNSYWSPSTLIPIGAAFVYFGEPGRLPRSPGLRLLPPNGFGGLGNPLASGDVNGDGFPDLLAGCWPGGLLMHGGPRGPAVGVGVLLPSPWVGFIGDFNDDGFGDVVTSFNRSSAAITQFVPGRGDTIPGPSVRFAEGVSPYLGYVMRDAGDLNADGVGDFVLGSLDGMAYIFFGRRGQAPTRPDISLRHEGPLNLAPSAIGSGFGSTLATGDLDGDGRIDLVIGNPLGGRVVIFRGTFDSFAMSPAMVLDRGIQSMFGGGVSIVGDSDGDGYEDLAVGQGDAFMVPFPSDLSRTLTRRLVTLIPGDSLRVVNLAASVELGPRLNRAATRSVFGLTIASNSLVNLESMVRHRKEPDDG